MAKLQTASVPGKETIYVDVDDEITAVIDKVRSAKGKVIALVLPKRATVLQSIVNMKLLKRTAEDSGKNLVLITSEAGLMPLAGNVGLYVADTPTSKPAIPPAPESPSDEPEDIDEPLDIVDNSAAPVEAANDFDAKAAAATPVGDLAGTAAAVPSKIAEDDIDESIDLDDDTAKAASAEVATETPKPKKDKKLAVPSFDSLKKRIALGAGLLALLVVAYIFAFVVLPKATVTVATDSSTITTNLTLTLDTTAKQLNAQNDTVPATSQTQQKTASQQVAATGQINNGQKANGQVTFTATVCNGAPVPANLNVGASVKSDAGQTYILQQNATFNQTGGHYPCGTFSTGGVNITALNAGTIYNTSGTTNFKTSGGTNGSGSADGGTDQITKIVSQSDINNATSKIQAADTASVKQQLASALQAKGLQAIPATFLAGTPQTTSSAQAGDTADNVTVTAVTSYTMLGVKKADLTTLVTNNVNGQLDKGKQVILDDGVANATFTEQNPGSATNAIVSMEAKSLAGPQLNVAQLKTALGGMKSGDVTSYLKQTPGVTNVNVKLSPFWVGSVPKKASKVTIVIDKTGNR